MNINAVKKLSADVKHIVTFYGYDVNYLPKQDPRWQTRYQELFATADLFLCEGSHMAKSLIALGCPDDKVKVHHLGVSVEKITFQPRIWNPNETLKVLIAGRFTEKKGIPYALEALGKIQNDVPLSITIIGDSTDEQRMKNEKAKILAIIDKYQLQSKVRMLGYQPHSVFFTEAYKNHIFISPSVTAKDGDTEGGVPVSIIELAATGMPIVSTNHCDIPEVIIDGVTGLLASERNVNELVMRLRTLINFPEIWQPIIFKARQHIEQEYNAIVQGRKLGEMYRDLNQNQVPTYDYK